MSYDSCKTQKERILFIREKLGKDWNWARRGVLRLYGEQTIQEQEAKNSAAMNGRGFNAEDASLLTKCAEQIIQGRKILNDRMAQVMVLMPKYAAQLERYAEQERKKKTGQWEI